MRHQAIYNTHPTIVSINESIGFFDRDGNSVVLNETLITTETERLQAISNSQEYARNRKTAYDKLNQLELISDDAINGTTTHKDAVLAIKAQYPKEA